MTRIIRPAKTTIYEMGLQVIASHGCEVFTMGQTCFDHRYGPARAADAKHGADQACYPCIATRVLALRPLPTAAEIGVEPRA